MREIHLANEKKRDAQVGFELRTSPRKISMVLPNGSPKSNVRVLKATSATDIATLEQTYGSLDAVGKAIIESDPEIDSERIGMLISSTRKVYMTVDGGIAYAVRLEEILYNNDGSEKERRPYAALDANVSDDIPLRWTGRMVPIEKAIRMFVFGRNYQIKHVNGLTYDFLFDMAQKLHDAKSVMLIGAGEKGSGPMIFSHGGLPYRGFLEGRVRDNAYCLILHLTNLELKELQ